MPRLTRLVALLVALPASAQADLPFADTAAPPHVCVLMAEPHVHREAGPPTGDALDALAGHWRASAAPASHVVVTDGPAATFVVTYTGFDAYPEAEAAYQSAVDLWATHVASAVPIVVTAEFLPLGTGVLGAAGPFLIRNFPGAPRTNVWYPYALADAIAGTNLAPGGTDIQSRFSSNFSNWYFGTDGLPPASKYDFRSVVLHELGHGLGFSGSARWDDGATTGRCNAVLGNGCWGYTPSGGFGGSAQIFDVLVEAGNGTPLLDTGVYANPSAALGTLLLSRDVWVRGPRIGTLPATERGKLWAPAGWQAGSSYSHWDESLYPRGSANAPMSPQIGPGESFSTPGPLTCAFFADMGWPLGPSCALFVADESGPTARAAPLRIVGANPFVSGTQVRLTLDVPQAVEAALYDVMGRRVQTLYAGSAPAGPLTLTVRGDGLASGVYAVRATVGGAVSEVRIVRAR